MEFALANRDFYEPPTMATSSGKRFNVDRSSKWDNWSSSESNGWVHWHPNGLRLPEQGWKIHISATISNADGILEEVSQYCNANELTFKYIPSDTGLFQRNMKYVDRGSSGKFVTIYPTDESQLIATLEELERRIGGREGPYILSDLRWNRGPLYIRYGGFRLKYTRDEHDTLIPAIIDPNGQLIPDERTPYFNPPAWLQLPDAIKRQMDTLGTNEPPDGFDYDILDALHFSNGGGVYRATQISTGRKVVLKEGRPYAGLTPDGKDAVSRIKSEAAILEELATEQNIVNILDEFSLFGHHFLSCEFVEGETLNKEIVLKNPNIRANCTTDDKAVYKNWAISVCEQIEEQLERIHKKGIVFGDLHPNNVMIGGDGNVKFIDLEMATHASDNTRVLSGAPGFVAPDHRRGFEADRYALGCIKLTMFVPLTMLLNLDPVKLETYLESAQETYDLPAVFIDSIRRDMNLSPSRGVSDSKLTLAATNAIRTWDTESAEAIRDIQNLIVRSIESSADLSRTDRLYPGDIRLFSENGFGLAHGAAGVIHALNYAGYKPDPLAIQWVEDAVADYQGSHLGLYDGIAGVGWLWRSMGRNQLADGITKRIIASDLASRTSDLYGGLAGVGLYLLSERRYYSDSSSVDEKLNDIFTILQERVRTQAEIDHDGHADTVATGKGGLFWGWSGVSVFASRLHSLSNRPEIFELAKMSLDFDLSRCVESEDGTLQVNEGWRVIPYLASGSVGCGFAIMELIEAGGSEHYLNQLSQIELIADSDFVIQPNLGNGRAGLAAFLHELERRRFATSQNDSRFNFHVQELSIHALRHGVGIGFPGEQLLRMSSDLMTGSAGVLTALEVARRRRDGYASAKANWLPLIACNEPLEDLDRAPDFHDS